MRFSWAAVAAGLLLCGPAIAQTAGLGAVGPENDSVSVGVGMICNTPEQAKQFIDLETKGTKPRAAEASVNAHARDPQACGMAAVAFVPNKILHTMALHNKLVKVIEINIVAGFDGKSWHQARMTQYAVVEDDDGLTI